ncbi:hypothetical protein BGZ81_009197 [Podila clonocystis]|nr:hypothetical protein BGZ81_009197 [Podila clonocystis]
MANINLYFVRHGQRIDQINSSWAATSPCPQDPPLTDQGRSQARQTGKMIHDFALEQSQNSKHSNRTKPRTSQDTTRTTSVQRITPPESPDLGRIPSANGATGAAGAAGPASSGRRHHFAIVTSPFLRCAQTAIEMAIGIAASENSHGNIDRDTTIAVEAGLAGKFSLVPSLTLCYFDESSTLSKWLSLEYAPEPVPDSIIVQRMQEFALARREHEQYYAIDWKYLAQERTLANWPETRDDMQTRVDRTLAHVIHSYGRTLQNKDVDLSIVFVTHASPVNALLEACLQTPILVPVPNCSISRCRWTPLKAGNEETTQGLRDVLMRSRVSQTVNQEHGHWLLDYQTYTRHLDRDHR